MIKKLLLPLSLLLVFTNAKAQFSGNALDFDGANDMVVVSTVPALFNSPATNDITIEAWVNPRGSLFARILFAQPSTTNFVSLGTSTGNVIYFYVIRNGTTYSVATAAGIPQNQWTHVAARWTAATNTTEVFFNGVLQATSAGGGSSTGTSGLMTLGTRPGGGTQYFNGALDEVRVWNEARTVCEIRDNMNHSITGTQTNLVVNYDFNQGTGGGNNTGITNLPDISGNSFNGTLTNFGLTAATSNWIISGATVTTSGNPVNGVSVSQSVSICSGGSYTFPDGSTQTNITATLSQLSTLQTVGGCDSLITTTVAINPTYSVNESAMVCSGGSYTFPDASTQSNITAQVMYTSSLQTIAGCDSLITTTVNVNPVYSINESAAICSGGSYTFPDASTQSNITAQVIYTSSLQTIAGCDSLIITTVNVNPVYSINESAAICSGGSYTFPDASTQSNITAQVIYTSSLQTIAGCDSLIITMVNVNPVYSMNIPVTVCPGSSYTFPDNSIVTNITSAFVQTSTLLTTAGCDSTITTAVSVTLVNANVTQAGNTLTAADSNAVYQWMNCANGIVVAGETSQNFTPAIGGMYALIITENGCTDTSACFPISVSINEWNNTLPNVSVYPNPAHDFVSVTLDKNTGGTIELIELSGAIVRTMAFIGTSCAVDMSGLADGLYFISIVTPEGKVTKQVIKN
ncbi:MAG: T9SS type A sorting domain-containing protein [Bacteroidota bacterium]|nr:T9SS type A sorting domain-containing protein [Bacteroidota bacterium]